MLLQLHTIQVTADSADEIIDNIASTLDSTNDEDQNPEVLSAITNVLVNVVDLLDGNFTVDESVCHHKTCM